VKLPPQERSFQAVLMPRAFQKALTVHRGHVLGGLRTDALRGADVRQLVMLGAADVPNRELVHQGRDRARSDDCYQRNDE